MPAGIQLKEPGSTVEIEPIGDSIEATTGTVFPGNIIEIRDVFGPDDLIDEDLRRAPYTIDFAVKGGTNPSSARDAGPLKIVTYTNIDGKFYIVDEGETVDSFVPGPGVIKATSPITVSNPITYNRDSTWTLKFTTTNPVPIGGFAKVELPPQVTLSPSTTISGGSCRKWSCEANDITPTSVIFKLTELIKRG
jgi:hypothetical protein